MDASGHMSEVEGGSWDENTMKLVLVAREGYYYSVKGTTDESKSINVDDDQIVFLYVHE